MKKFRILAIDGGGIRGLISAIWLNKIEEAIGRPIAETFDLIVGTSTGSITAAAAAARMDLSECISLYRREGARIFPPRRRRLNKWGAIKYFAPMYSAARLQRTLAEFFEKRQLSDIGVSPRLLVPAYSTFGRQILQLRSYDKADHTKPLPQGFDRPLWEVCKASSSAPTYFAAHPLRHDVPQPVIDGGMFANNPSLLGLAEAIRMLPGESVFDVSRDYDIVLVSLGAGRQTRRITPQQAGTWGTLGWARPSIDVLMDSSSELADLCAHQILPNEAYVRMQVELNGANDDMDDATEENIKNLVLLANAHLNSIGGQSQLDRIVKLVSDNTPLTPPWRDDWGLGPDGRSPQHQSPGSAPR